MSLLLLFGGAGIPTPQPLYNLGTSGGSPSLKTTGGTPSISTTGGAPTLNTKGPTG